MMNQAKSAYIVAHSKSQFVGLLLTFIFGPLGLIYSNLAAAVLLTVLSIPLFPFGLVLIWPISMVVGVFTVRFHNLRVVGTANLLGGHASSESSGVASLTNTQGTKKCPFCAEEIKEEAKVCRYCGRDIPDTKDIPEVDWATRYMTSMKDAERERLSGLASLTREQRQSQCPACKGANPACSKCAQTETSVGIFISAKEWLERNNP
jgi:hypothetical protein